jgi:hypothetical protein
MLEWLRSNLGWLPRGMFVPDEHPEARKFINRMHSEALPFIAARTVVLYGATEKGLPYILATAVPLRCGPRHFLLTASHALDEIKAQKAAVYLRPGTDGGQLLPLDPLRAHRSAMPGSGIRLADAFDVCVIEIPDAVVSHPVAGITYTELMDIDPYEVPHAGSYYFLNGYPSQNLRINRCRKTVRNRSLPYGTIIYDGSRGEYPQHEDVHLDLDFNPHKAGDDKGRRVRLPDPRGISGCGIWRLSRAGASRSEWSVTDVKLVAIEHRYNETLHVLRSTHIKYVNRILYDCLPELRATMANAWPH